MCYIKLESQSLNNIIGREYNQANGQNDQYFQLIIIITISRVKKFKYKSDQPQYKN